jgi:hypothetical protein
LIYRYISTTYLKPHNQFHHSPTMKNSHTLALLSTLLPSALGLSQATTTILEIPGMDEKDGSREEPTLYASVVSANPTATTLALACLDDCGLFPAQTLTYGASTWKMDMSVPGDGAFTMTQDCAFAESTAVCKESASGSEANFPGSSTETYSWTGYASIVVTVTEGVGMLGAEATGTATGRAQEVTETETGMQTSTLTYIPSGIFRGPPATGSPNATRGTPSGGAPPESTGAAGANVVACGSVGLGLVAALLLL